MKDFKSIGIKVNNFTDIGNFRYFVDSNMGGRHYSVAILDLTTRERTQVCTRANLSTALNLVQSHINMSAKEVVQ